jgi:hypothetical protein
VAGRTYTRSEAAVLHGLLVVTCMASLACSREPIADAPPSREALESTRPVFQPPPPIELGAPDCAACWIDETGSCHLEILDACDPGVPGQCEHSIPCEASCCDRFPIRGAVAKLRPGKPMFEDAAQDRKLEVLRAPAHAGVLVLITAIADSGSPVYVDTISGAPTACTSALDELNGVRLMGTVDSADLEPVSPDCASAARRRAHQTVSWRVISADHELRSADGDWRGHVISPFAVPEDEIYQKNGRECFRLPGAAGPEVCPKPGPD